MKNKKLFPSKGDLKENKLQSHRNNCKSRTTLTRPRFLKFISTENETKTEQTESLLGKFSW